MTKVQTKTPPTKIAKKRATKPAPKAQESKQVANVSRETQPMRLIEIALANDVDVERLEKLMELQERWESRQAEKAFHEAMCRFQGEMPPIQKQKPVMNKDGRTVRYKYAPLGLIQQAAALPMVRAGLSASFDVSVQDGWVQSTCTVHHVAGHSESATFGCPVDPDMYANEAQKVASATTFANRYAFMNALRIIVQGEDDDGQQAHSLITGKQVIEVKDMLDSKDIPHDKFLRFLGVESFEDITPEQRERTREFVNVWTEARK